MKNRRLNRLKNFDYSQNGMYFVTICTKNRECLFGEILDGKMELNEYGQIATDCWKEIPKHFPSVEIDEFVVMPNHVHGIITIVGAGLAGLVEAGVGARCLASGSRRYSYSSRSYSSSA